MYRDRGVRRYVQRSRESKIYTEIAGVADVDTVTAIRRDRGVRSGVQRSRESKIYTEIARYGNDDIPGAVRGSAGARARGTRAATTVEAQARPAAAQHNTAENIDTVLPEHITNEWTQEEAEKNANAEENSAGTSYQTDILQAELTTENIDIGLPEHIINEWTQEEAEKNDNGILYFWTGGFRCMNDACRAAVSFVRPFKREPQAYWWSTKIATLRMEAIRANASGPVDAPETRGMFPSKRGRSKSGAWQELINTLDEDPWGIPYKIVLNKLRKSTPGLSVTLEPDVLRTLLDRLFPPGNPLVSVDLGDCEEGRTPVTEEETKKAISAKKNSSTAPGPGGFKATVLKMMPPSMIARLTQCFNIFLKYGVFPPSWKVADLVLIPKGETALGEVLKARPICLLNEVGKTFERVIADRLINHMDENPNANLSDYQFGFRRMRSTTDALLLVKEIITEARKNGMMALAFSIDIEKVFNFVKLPGIRRALRARHFPKYLRRIVESYLSGRKIRYRTPDGKRHDTLLIVVGDDFDTICAKAMECLERILINIRSLGLKVSWSKSEAIFFGKCPRDSFIEIEGHKVYFSNIMKYLGVTCGFWESATGVESCAPPRCLTHDHGVRAEVCAEEWLTLRRQWAEHIRHAHLSGKRTREAIASNFDAWLDRSVGFLSFRITQILTGHGCFGSYFHRIGKEETPICRYCNLVPDTAEHTLSECNFWRFERGELTAAIGQDLSFAAVVSSICDSRVAWSAFATFAERVMSKKEDDERRRQQSLLNQMIVDGTVPEDPYCCF
ncbi:uncharacterized protein [Temnothorax nylanderi]|uniref:uncharacterized protein n=1 Tax=Temnothorax nylanderi TaxID=102681 RepID=UPI003A895E08